MTHCSLTSISQEKIPETRKRVIRRESGVRTAPFCQVARSSKRPFASSGVISMKHPIIPDNQRVNPCRTEPSRSMATISSFWTPPYHFDFQPKNPPFPRFPDIVHAPLTPRSPRPIARPTLMPCYHTLETRVCRSYTWLSHAPTTGRVDRASGQHGSGQNGGMVVA